MEGALFLAKLKSQMEDSDEDEPKQVTVQCAVQ